jgi:hypothetical protein
MTTYEISRKSLTVIVIDKYGERTDLNAHGEPCITVDDLRAFVRELHQQGSFLQPLIAEAEAAAEPIDGCADRAAEIRDELLAEIDRRAEAGTIRDGVTTEQIEALRSEAGAAGDREQVTVCDRALAGDEAAIRECARVIRAARDVES